MMKPTIPAKKPRTSATAISEQYITEACAEGPENPQAPVSNFAAYQAMDKNLQPPKPVTNLAKMNIPLLAALAPDKA